jgi:predicted PurR-regulated permease PerM
MAAEEPDAPSDQSFIFKVLFVALIAALIAAVYTLALVFILSFGAIIVAAALNNIAAPLGKRLHIPHRLALGLTTIGLIVIFAGFIVVFGSQAADRFQALVAELPQAWTATRTWLGSWDFGRWMLSIVDTIPADATAGLLSALPVAGGLLTWVANAALILIIGVYLAADAHTYIEGSIALVPPNRRRRARAIIHAAGEDLRKWLIAMTLDMLFLGVCISIGLWIIGIPFAFALGAISGVSVFVPYIGPLLSLVPGLLLALSVSPQHALYAGIVYTIALQLEGNVALPLLQRWTVHLPPAVSMLAIVGFGLLFGIWGVLLATPLAVVTMTFVRMAYVEDFLEAKHG